MRHVRSDFRARVPVLAVACGLAVGGAPAALLAQQQNPSGVTQQGSPIPAADSSAAAAGKLRRPPVVTTPDLVIGASLVTAAVALIPADGQIAREFQRTGPQSSVVLRETAEGAEWIASPGALIFGGSLYVAGLATRKRSVADVGWHTLEALAVSTQVTTALKGLFGRTRPYAANGDARDFDLAGGFRDGDRRSFPSGHTSAAFTLASVVAEETSHRWPRAYRAVAPLAYAAATSVGLARMYNDKHWSSDVALGAAIGTLSGRIIVRYAHGRPGNAFDRIALWPVRGR
jgi:membrane-associated phospholipid phosphatase